MEIVISLICSSSASCCSNAVSDFWIFFFFFLFLKSLCLSPSYLQNDRTGIEKYAVKLFQTHGGSDNESPKLSLPANTFLIPSAARALLLLCPHPATTLSSRHEDQKRIPGSPVLELAPSQLFNHTFIPSRAWDSTGHLAGRKSAPDEGNRDVPTSRFSKISSPLYTTRCGSLTPLLMISTPSKWQGSEQCPLCSTWNKHKQLVLKYINKELLHQAKDVCNCHHGS